MLWVGGMLLANTSPPAMKLALEAGDDVYKATMAGDLFRRSPLLRYVMWPPWLGGSVSCCVEVVVWNGVWRVARNYVLWGAAK